jgi:hypothetical protein
MASAYSPSIVRETVAIATGTGLDAGKATNILTTKNNGYIVGWHFNAGDMTDLWDFTITSAVSDADILQGAGANQSSSDSMVWFDAAAGNKPIRVRTSSFETLTMNVTNGGDTKTGTLYVYFEKLR